VSDSVHTGGCLCGAVRYRVTGPLRPVVACHCEQCRRTSGHYVAATRAAGEDVTLEADRGLKWYTSSDNARRGFCGECGASVLWQPSHRQTMSIMAGTLDEPTGLTLAGHIFVANKGDYYPIADGLPQLEQGNSDQLFAKSETA